MNVVSPSPARLKRKLSADALRRFMVELLRAEGCPEDSAALAAEHFLGADLRGVGLQGLDHLFSMLRNLRAGKIDPNGRPKVIRDAPAYALIDGGRGPGQVAGAMAADIASEKAKSSGIAAAGVVNSADLFMLGLYVERMARKGSIGFAFSDTPPLVHPHGGNERLLGTNPLAFAAPTMGEPLIFDMSTSALSASRIRHAAYHGEQVPPGMGVDLEGRPTTSATAILEGAIAPGGHKGFGLALMVALLSGPLVGADVGRAQLGWLSGRPDPGGSKGHLFIAIDPSCFTTPEAFREAATAYLDDIKSSRRPEGAGPIRIPGERALAEQSTSLAEGVVVLDAVWQRAIAAAAERGVAVPEAPLL